MDEIEIFMWHHICQKKYLVFSGQSLYELCTSLPIIFNCYISKFTDHCWGRPEGSLYNSFLHWGVSGDTTIFLRFLPLTLDPYFIMLSVKQRSIKYHCFETLGWFNLGLNPSHLDHWQTLYPLHQWDRQQKFLTIYNSYSWNRK